MGTIINGNKWIGACVNGNIVSGLVKNGLVFYKRNRQELYKRRIMVGDNLKGKNIYPEFTTSSTDRFVDNLKRNMIIFNDNNNESIYLIQHGVSEGLCSDIIASISNAEYIYRWIGAGNFKQNNITIFNDKDYFVTNIYDSLFSSYRCLFIEDENIRPFEIGDIITAGTKIYFNFPDNFKNSIIDDTYLLGTVLINTNSNSKFGEIKIISPSNFIPPFDWSGSVPDGIAAISLIDENEWGPYQTLISSESPQVNESVYTFTKNDMATVTNVLEELKEYILVDTTTLGN